NINIPWCYFPVNTGYVASHKNASLTILKRYSKSPASPFGKTIDDLTLKQTQIGATLNVRIGYDGSYEPPVYIPRQPSSSPEKLSLVEGGSMSNINNAVYSFSITRGNGATRIWDTSIGTCI
ncbi:hypothetical protein Tcan_00434, partial [Toxocara canis]